MRRVLFMIFVGALAACGTSAVPFTPPSFERPGDVAFVCFDTNPTPNVAVGLDRCRKDENGALEAGFILHGLVLQTARGEIAAVDLVNNRLLDSDISVPGYTFIEAGDLPTALVVPSVAPADGSPVHVYVANAGSHDVWSIPANRFRTISYGEEPWSARVELDGGPTALVLSPDERFLFAAVPERGSLYQIEVLTNGGLGAPVEIPLANDVPAAVPGSHEDPYERVCTTASILPAGERPTRTPESNGTQARPAALIVDNYSSPPALLVADSALPIVHRLPIEDSGLGTELPGVAVEVTTRDIAVTPPVPTALDGSGAARYLYAIDAHGDVLSVDYTEGPSFGQVLSVNVAYSRATDRIAFLPLATTIEVVTPGYNVEAPAEGLCVPPTDTSVGANRLHGVFLSVGFADGTVRLVDIYDLDAPCRGEAGVCTGGAGSDSTDSIAYIRRNRPRIGETIVNEIGTVGSVAFILNGTTWTINSAGDTASPASLPGLETVGSCPTGFVDAYPDNETDPTLICTLYDPWTAVVESWSAQYEGLMVAGDAGRFDTGSDFIGDTNFCWAGVLGNANIPALDETVPESRGGSIGDQMMITANLPPGETRTECQIYIATDAVTGARLPLAFEITQSFEDHLVLGPMIGRGDIVDSARSIEAVKDCFGELVSFSVRTRASYLVSGGRSGRPHRVIPGTDGSCIVDTTQALVHQSRAFGGVPFANEHVAFQIRALDNVDSTTSLSFAIGNVPLQLGADVGSQPNELHYTDVDGYLYAVDTASDSLVRLQLNEFRVLNTFR